MIVLKFGGSSVRDAEAIKSVVAIAAGFCERQPLVVASACAGVTNQLVGLADAAAVNDQSALAAICDDVRERHLAIAEQVTADSGCAERTRQATEALCRELSRFARGIAMLRECTARARAQLLSFGERLSTTLLHAAFQEAGHRAVLLDARKALITDSDYLMASVRLAESTACCEEHIRPLLEQGNIVVTQGFIGANLQGITTTNGRGGGDLSAALFGAALQAEEIQIWTDVSGVYTTDPRIVPEARTIPRLTFAEAGELAYFGARVLHPDTIRPAIEHDIPVRVRNTFAADEAGTLILPDDDSAGTGIRALAMQSGMYLISFALRPHQKKNEFLAALYSCMAKRGWEAAAAQGSEHHYLVCLADADAVADLRKEMESFADCTIREAALICACGPRVTASGEGVARATVSRALAAFETLLLQHQAGNISIIAAVPERKGREALRALHKLISP